MKPTFNKQTLGLATGAILGQGAFVFAAGTIYALAVSKTKVAPKALTLAALVLGAMAGISIAKGLQDSKGTF